MTVEYTCPFNECNRKYTSRSGFINHQKKHNDNHELEAESIQHNSSFEMSLYSFDFQEISLDRSDREEENDLNINDSSALSCLNPQWYYLLLDFIISVLLKKAYIQQQGRIRQLQLYIKKLEALSALVSKAQRKRFEESFSHSQRDVQVIFHSFTLSQSLDHSPIDSNNTHLLPGRGKTVCLRRSGLFKALFHVQTTPISL